MLLAIVWRGWGILAAIIPGMAVILMQLLAESLGGAGAYQQNKEWLFAVGLLLSAPIVWFLGRRLNRGQPRRLVDQTTGESVIFQKRHSMFFIKFEYWALIWAASATALIVNACQPSPNVEIQPEDTIESIESTEAPTAPEPETAPAESNTVARVEPESDGEPELPPPGPSAAQPVQTQYGPDSSEVDLMPVKVTGDVMTVTVRYRSQNQESLSTRYPIAEVSYIDDATSKRYGVVQDQAGSWLASPKGSPDDSIRINIYDNSAIAWFKFPAPPPEAQTISINIPEVSPFDGIEVER
ncbi:MAG: hypothetical protein ACFB4I_21045 [Cyanophyceae cyanobacterium]